MSDCPVCKRSMHFNPRYPRAVCLACGNMATDKNGRPVAFFNEGLSGGIFGRYKDDGASYESTTCFIHGLPCKASEAHMGGIVIELL
ncbi:MAG: hypothetical protein GX577_05430 [Leptolinea sp.]|nr:hypothetical protein [Leptolinea sp.]